MHLTLRQLKVFESVARHLSFTHAARELHLTQPAVSMQIKQLEEQAGLPLLEQFGKKNYLTEAGRELYQYSKSILQQLEELDEIMLDLKGLRRGCLDLAVATTANDFATRLLAAFSRENEGLSYRLAVTNRETLLAQLENNEKDLVIMGRPPVGKSLTAEAFMDNPLVVIAPPGHRLAGTTDITLEQLVKETFVVREKASGTRIAMERFFKEHGFALSTKMEMTSNESIKNAVQAGLGLGLVSMHTVRLELETGRLVVLDVEDFPILRHWYIVHRKGKRLSSVARAFKDFVLERASEFAIIAGNAKPGEAPFLRGGDELRG